LSRVYLTLYHVSLLIVKRLNVVHIFVILSQFASNFLKLNQFQPYIKFNFYINFTMVFLL